jgi:hypothetical protein
MNFSADQDGFEAESLCSSLSGPVCHWIEMHDLFHNAY